MVGERNETEAVVTETDLAPADNTGAGPGGCPVVSVDIGQSGPILSHFEEWDRLREQYPAFWSELYGGHWVVTRFDAIRQALQEPATFSNESTIVSDPNPSYTFIPTFLDPPEHGKYRTLYNARFSPGMVTRVTPAAREAANRYIDAFIEDGRCDFMTAFADPFPTDVFLNAVNLPAADTPQFVSWVHAIFGGLSGQEQEAGVDAQAEMRDYFKAMYDRRRTDPEDPEVDILTYLLSSKVDGEPIPEDDLLNMAVVLVLAGLDTTKSQLGYNFHYLATHPEDRGQSRRRPVVDADGDRGAVALSRLRASGAQAQAGRRVRRLPDAGGSDGADAVVVGDARPAGVRGRRHREDRPHPEPAHRLRRRAAPLRRRPSRPPGAARGDGGVAQAHSRLRARRLRADRRAWMAVRSRQPAARLEGVMRIKVDAELCSGQGRCYSLSPEVFQSDDEGFVLQSGTEFDVAPEDEDSARLGVASCPEGAITVVDEP